MKFLTLPLLLAVAFSGSAIDDKKPKISLKANPSMGMSPVRVVVTADLNGGANGAVLQPDGRKMPEPRMDAKAVGDAVAYMATLPLDANVLFMTVMASKMPFVGRG